jgi:hypothetical protein
MVDFCSEVCYIKLCCISIGRCKLNDLPDINKLDQIAAAIGNIDVLGGYSRSYTDDGAGGFIPDRYIEKLNEYVSEFAIKQAVEMMFFRSHYVNGVDGVIVSCSADQLEIEYASGEKRTFRVVSS